MSSLHNRNEIAKLFYSGHIPFAFDESTYRRFPQKNTIFSRVNWDESYVAFRRSISERETEKVNKPGYSRVGYAVRAASWTVHDNFKGAFAWDRIRSIPQERYSQLVSKLPKYKPSSLEKNAKLVKRVAQIFGACDIGICRLDPAHRFVYSHDEQGNLIQLPDGVRYAIVMLIKMDYEGIRTSPALPASIATGHAYSQMAFTIASMGEFLRNLGYTAVSSGNDTGLSVPLAIQSGLGQFGRNGLLIHPKLGLRVRICKVFTDFPMATDKPINFGATEFCKVCKKCATHCPSKSIPTGDPTWESPYNTISNNNGVLKWYVNVDKCYNYWVRNSSDCSNCIRVCPFTKPPGFRQNIFHFFVKRLPFMNRVFVFLDELMGKIPLLQYGKQKDPERFWHLMGYLDK